MPFRGGRRSQLHDRPHARVIGERITPRGYGGLSAGQVLELRVWATSTALAHHTHQRLQAILCPELESWFDRHEREVPVVVALADRVVRLELVADADGARIYSPEVSA